jgi:hypothetical protein
MRGVETFVSFESWRSAAVLLNLVAFFCGFSAFSVGLLIAARVKRLLASAQGAMLAGLVHAFLVASGALALRSLAIVLYHLEILPASVALPVSDLSLVGVGGALFWAYLVLERFLSKKESG